MTSTPMTGKHILAEFWECQCAHELLTATDPLLNLLVKAVEVVGLTLVGQAVHEFGDYAAATGTVTDEQTSGVTLTLLLAESHLCLHTWGEYQTVTLDVYVCNVSNDNSAKADALLIACQQIFKPTTVNVQHVSRCHRLPTDPNLMMT